MYYIIILICMGYGINKMSKYKTLISFNYYFKNVDSTLLDNLCKT